MTPWSRIIRDKTKALSQVTNVVLYTEAQIHDRAQKNLPLDLILSHNNPIYSLMNKIRMFLTMI
jgi:hypothetical protein